MYASDWCNRYVCHHIRVFSLENDCHQGNSLLFQHDDSLEVLSGLSPDDAMIQPSQDGKNYILISNFTGCTQRLEGGDVIGQAVQADIVHNSATDTSDSVIYSICHHHVITRSSPTGCPRHMAETEAEGSPDST